uniref:Uncharacterized protein n=1 Tax=Candidatus Methanogaster sp. ANME-2c ERB4 TaxID=2759911 RepID=A0A7G9YAQ7_9EURY|nr:hypothetical protein KNJBMNFM_00002 [Methanosarcinales archaeon ANME-2c ERB4]
MLSQPALPRSVDVLHRISLISEGEMCGLYSIIIATSPDTCGADIEVPLCKAYPSPELASGAVTSTPTAQTSGLILPSVVGPLEEKDAESRQSVIAPTVITFPADAGILIVPLSDPSFPAATQTTIPESTARSHAISIGDVPSPFTSLPQLIESISMPYTSFSAMHHSIPAIQSEVAPYPVSFSTFTPTIVDIGATPA